MDIGALDDMGLETGPAKWAAETGTDKMAPGAQLRKYSQELLKGNDAFKVVNVTPQTKTNAIMPQASIPGAIADDDMEEIIC